MYDAYSTGERFNLRKSIRAAAEIKPACPLILVMLFIQITMFLSVEDTIVLHCTFLTFDPKTKLGCNCLVRL